MSRELRTRPNLRSWSGSTGPLLNYRKSSWNKTQIAGDARMGKAPWFICFGVVKKTTTTFWLEIHSNIADDWMWHALLPESPWSRMGSGSTDPDVKTYGIISEWKASSPVPVSLWHIHLARFAALEGLSYRLNRLGSFKLKWERYRIWKIERHHHQSKQNTQHRWMYRTLWSLIITPPPLFLKFWSIFVCFCLFCLFFLSWSANTIQYIISCFLRWNFFMIQIFYWF